MPKPKKTNVRLKEKPTRIERRARITFFLVAETQQEVNAVREVIHYLLYQYWFHLLGGEWEIPVTGFTHSFIPREVPKRIGIMFGPREEDSIFVGHWWSKKKRRIKEVKFPVPVVEKIEENVILFVIDLPLVTEEWKLDDGIVRLKKEIFLAYKRNKRAQEEIWIVKQDIHRYA